MFGKKDVSDKELLKTINRKLERTGTGSQSKITASVQRGTVTVTGKLQYENLLTPIVKEINSVAGVRLVIDRLIGPPRNKVAAGN